jgi:hypothetical protein
VVAGPVSLAVILQTGFDTLVEQLFICCSLPEKLNCGCLDVLPVEFAVLFEKFAVDVGVDVHDTLTESIGESL